MKRIPLDYPDLSGNSNLIIPRPDRIFPPYREPIFMRRRRIHHSFGG